MSRKTCKTNHYHDLRCSKALYDEFTQKFPMLRGRSAEAKALRRLAAVVFLSRRFDRMDVFGRGLDRDPGGVVVPHELLAWCEGKQPYHNGYVSGPLLARFAKAVNGRFYKDWERTQGVARTISTDDLYAFVPKLGEDFANELDAIDHYLDSVRRAIEEGLPTERIRLLFREPDPMGRYVDFGTGLPWTSAAEKRTYADRKKVAKEIERLYQDHPAIRAMKYLHRLDNKFFKPAETATNSARNLAESMPGAETGAKRQQVAMAILDLIQTQPGVSPLYKPSENGSARVFGDHPILWIPSEFRGVLFPDWVELDLRNCQLAIVAKLWGVERIAAFLETGQSIWDYLMRQIGCSAAMKPDLKKAIYAVTYGKDPKSLDKPQREGRRLLPPILDPVTATEFRENDIVRELVSGCKQRLAEIKRHGGDRDCFGILRRAEAGRGGHGARSVLAGLSQALELKILLPAFDLAAKRKDDFQIMLFQHDGFSVLIRRPERRDEILSEIKGAVNAACKAQGVLTELLEK